MGSRQFWVAAIAGVVLIALAFGAGYGLGLDRGIRSERPAVGAIEAGAQGVGWAPAPRAVLAHEEWVDPPYPYSDVPASLESMARSLESISRTLESGSRRER